MAAAAVLMATTAALVARVAWREAPAHHTTAGAAAAAAQYVLNPITLAACAFLPPATLARNALLAACVAAASDACGLGTAVLLVFAAGALLPVQAGVAALPLAVLAGARSRARWRTRGLASWVVREVAGAAAAVAFLAAAVWAQLLPWPPSPALGLAGISTTSMWPELSLWWYLLALAFGRHMPYFAPIVWAHPLAYIVPVTLRLRCVKGLGVCAGGGVRRARVGGGCGSGRRLCAFIVTRGCTNQHYLLLTLNPPPPPSPPLPLQRPAIRRGCGTPQPRRRVRPQRRLVPHPSAAVHQPGDGAS